MSYALTVGVCIKYPMAYQTLHLNVQNARVNKDYDTLDISPYLWYARHMKLTYGKIKMEAEKKHPYDMDAYLRMKGEIINKIYQELGLD